MTPPLKRFFTIAFIVLLCYGLIAGFMFKRPSQSVDAEQMKLVRAEIDRFADLLQNEPIHSWEDRVLLDDRAIDVWVEVGSIETFDPADTEKLRAGESLVSGDANAEPFVSRLVAGTGHVLTLYPAEQYFAVWNWLELLTIAMLLFLFALYYLIVVLPLRRQLSTIELAAQGYASGNFSIRVPTEDTAQHPDATRGFNEMAAQIEDLIAENNSMLEDYREMLRAVAHEFRGPLARIRFALDMAADEGGDNSPKLLHRMSNDIDGLNLLVGEVLSYARLQPGAPGFSFARIRLDEIVDNALAECRLNYPSIEFAMSAASNRMLIVEIDSYYMQRAILNLLNNAARHANKNVSVGWGVDQRNYSIWVDDDGAGVPAQWKERIFEPFVRVDPSRSRQSGGVGLGLSIARRIAENHHGNISVDSAPELGGARFCLAWPIGLTQCQQPSA